MELIRERVFPITEPSQSGEARRTAQQFAVHLGFDETDAGKAAILAAELASNLVKHTPDGGHLLVRASRLEDVPVIELMALDKGPGIRDVGASLQDGYSTAGSSGTGLGALTRLSTDWDMHSAPGIGTAVLARLWGQPRTQLRRHRLDIGAMRIPAPGEMVCGDAWSVYEEVDRLVLMVADGLGHGHGAAEAADAAVRAFGKSPARPPAEILDGLHRALRPTRGAAVAVAELDLAERVLNFAGIGNISAFVIETPTDSKSMISHNGTVGHEIRRIQELRYPLPASGVVVLHSDGLSARWDISRYPGILARDPLLIAGILWRDFSRGRDDATVVVVRLEPQREGPIAA